MLDYTINLNESLNPEILAINLNIVMNMVNTDEILKEVAKNGNIIDIQFNSVVYDSFNEIKFKFTFIHEVFNHPEIFYNPSEPYSKISEALVVNDEIKNYFDEKKEFITKLFELININLKKYSLLLIKDNEPLLRLVDLSLNQQVPIACTNETVRYTYVKFQFNKEDVELLLTGLETNTNLVKISLNNLSFPKEEIECLYTAISKSKIKLVNVGDFDATQKDKEILFKPDGILLCQFNKNEIYINFKTAIDFFSFHLQENKEHKNSKELIIYKSSEDTDLPLSKNILITILNEQYALKSDINKLHIYLQEVFLNKTGLKFEFETEIITYKLTEYFTKIIKQDNLKNNGLLNSTRIFNNVFFNENTMGNGKNEISSCKTILKSM